MVKVTRFVARYRMQHFTQFWRESEYSPTNQRSALALCYNLSNVQGLTSTEIIKTSWIIKFEEFIALHKEDTCIMSDTFSSYSGSIVHYDKEKIAKLYRNIKKVSSHYYFLLIWGNENLIFTL